MRAPDVDGDGRISSERSLAGGDCPGSGEARHAALGQRFGLRQLTLLDGFTALAPALGARGGVWGDGGNVRRFVALVVATPSSAGMSKPAVASPRSWRPSRLM